MKTLKCSLIAVAALLFSAGCATQQNAAEPKTAAAHGHAHKHGDHKHGDHKHCDDKQCAHRHGSEHKHGEGAKCTCGQGAKAHKTAGSSAPKAFATKPAVGTKAQCAVSGETFAVKADTQTAEHGGKHYAFCCGGCAKKFAADPAKYAN